MDATAGIAIGSRKGIGRVKHIDTVFLWVQAMVTEGKISLRQEAHQRDACGLPHQTCLRCHDAELHDRTWHEVRAQADSESVIE